MSHDDYTARPREQRRRRMSKAQRAAIRKPVGAASLPPVVRQAMRGLNGDGAGSALAAELALPTNRPARLPPAEVRGVLVQFARRFPRLAARPAMLATVARVVDYRTHWQRDLDDWTPPVAEAGRPAGATELSWSLACHLFCRRLQYPPPRWMLPAWFGDDPLSRPARNWFVHVAGGQNLRTATGLPYPLTKLMAHHAMLAPAYLTPGQALRFGQARALHLPSPPAAEAIARTRLGLPQRDEAFWLKFCDYYGRNWPLLRHGIDRVVDFCHALRFGDFGMPPEPRLDIDRYDPLEMSMLAEDWHDRRTRLRGSHLSWRSCGIRGHAETTESLFGPEPVRIVELRSAGELRHEGDAMQHCVFTYVDRAAHGECAIFSLQRRDARRRWNPSTTIEVVLPEKVVLQARARENMPPEPADQEVIRRWAAAQGLELDLECFHR